jgi:hypothetical protein
MVIFPYPDKSPHFPAAAKEQPQPVLHNALPPRKGTLPVMATDLTNAATMATSIAVESPSMASTTILVAAPQGSGWFGFLLWFVMGMVNLVSMTLYWAVRFVTISVPGILLNLLSASWTVTMNATTLYVYLPPDSYRPCSE